MLTYDEFEQMVREELSLLPHLTTLILSEAAAQGAPEQPELYDGYTLIVRGGDGQ